eukprot:GFYU01003444.1.p1 GENE.GFYU01003444.1~~GFYU01003444.1.p1  ORF type:complete len:157 (+),score=35.62 GFYU01003444.1:52-522(+)
MADFPVPKPRKELLFYIQRTKNANTVIYEAKLDKDGSLNAKEPVVVFWEMYAKSADGPTEGLNFMERNQAYGLSAKSTGESGVFEVTLKAFNKRKVTVRLDGEGNPAAFIEINGVQCRLHKIWVEAKETSMLPSVAYVELSGVDADGNEVSEKVYP